MRRRPGPSDGLCWRNCRVPVRHFLATEAGSAGLLLGATVLALLWANSPWSGLYEALWHAEASVSLAGFELSMDLEHWVNDALLTSP